MNRLLENFHSKDDEDFLDVDIYMLQAILMVAPNSKSYIVSNVLFHKDGGSNVAVTNCMSHFSMFVPNKASVKLANINTVHGQVIRIIFCRFPNCSIIYPVVPVYYFTVKPYYTISPGTLKFYVGFKNITSELPEHYHFVDPQGLSWRSLYQTKKRLTIFK